MRVNFLPQPCFRLILVLTILLVNLDANIGNAGAQFRQTVQNDQWIPHLFPDFVVWEACNRVSRTTGRRLYLFKDHELKPDRVKEMLISIADKYPSPEEVVINLFDDKDPLQEAIRADFSSVCILIKENSLPRNEAVTNKPMLTFIARTLSRAYLIRADGYLTVYLRPDPDSESYQRLAMIKLPMKKEVSVYSNLIKAITLNDSAWIKEILSSGFYINEKDEDGWTPLMYATRHNRPEITTMLIDRGSQINIQNTEGLTPLMLAAYYGNHEIVKTLLERGAEINTTDKNGRTALIEAVIGKQMNIVELLLDQGASTKIATLNGQTALSIANLMGDGNLVRLLEEAQQKH